MKKLTLSLLSLGLLLGLTAPAIAQDSGRANTLEDFKSADNNGGLFGSDMNIWDIFHRSGSLSGATVDDGFRRSQSRRINRQAADLRERQRQLIEQRAAEAEATSTGTSVPVEVTPQ